MAPKGQKKRVAPVEQSISPQKRRIAADPVIEKCCIIVAALGDADFLSDSVRNMLVSMVTNSLRVKRDQRHPYQESAIEMFGETLTGMDAAMQKVIDELEARVAGSEADKARRDAARQEAVMCLVTRQEAVAAKKTALEECSAVLEEATNVLSSAEIAQKTGDADVERAEDKKAKLEAALQDALEPMKTNKVDGTKGKTLLKTIERMSKQCKFDSSLMAAVPSTLNKEPSMRTAFDALTVQELDNEFSKNICALEKFIADAEPERAERADNVQTAQAACDAAKETKLVNATDLARAEAEQAEAEAILHEATLAVTSFLPELKSVMDSSDAAKAKLAAFRDGPFLVFGELKDCATPPTPSIDEAAADESTTDVTEEAALRPLDTTADTAMKSHNNEENVKKLAPDADGISALPIMVISGAGA